MKSRVLWLFVCALSVAVPAVAGTQPTRVTGWRGDGSGRFADAQPPTQWSKDSDNILWKIEPGKGYSSPVLCQQEGARHGLLLLTAEPSDVMCIDAATGEIGWRQTTGYAVALGQAEAARIAETHARLEAEKRAASEKYEALRKADPQSADLETLSKLRDEAQQRQRQFEREFPAEKRGGAGNAAASVVCDGRRVFAVFGTGIVAAFDLDGQRLWARHLEAPTQGFGHSASPVLAGGRLIVHIDHLTALDPDTGETVWRVELPAKFGTPAVVPIAGQDVLITPSGAVVAAGDGRVLASKQFQLSENSPIVHDGVLFAHEAGSVKAFRLPETIQTPFELELLWESRGTRDQRIASALYHDGLLYASGRDGIMDLVDAQTGDIVYRKRLALGQVFTSPTLAGGLIYLAGKDGRTLVLRPGRQFDEVATNESERFSTTPLFSGRRMYLRTDRYLYCIGQ